MIRRDRAYARPRVRNLARGSPGASAVMAAGGAGLAARSSHRTAIVREIVLRQFCTDAEGRREHEAREHFDSVRA